MRRLAAVTTKKVSDMSIAEKTGGRAAAAAVADAPVVIQAPASKSLSHRYLIGAALARGESTVRHALESADIDCTRAILCGAGATMERMPEPPGESGVIWRVLGMEGKPRGGHARPLSCDVGESGTTCRLLTAVLAAGDGLFRIHGHGRMHERPIGELCAVLTRLGAVVDWEGSQGCPPLVLKASGLDPALADGVVSVGMESSSQYFSGLLLAAPLCPSPLTLELSGRKAVSWPYVGLTLQCLTDFGIRFRVAMRARVSDPWETLTGSAWRNLHNAAPGCLRVTVWPGAYQAGNYSVEGDWSGASYFLAAGALGHRPVRVDGLRPDSLQGDRAMLAILRKMGATVTTGDDSVTVWPSALHGVELDMGACPDLVPTVAVLAAYATGSTRIRNVAHLRLKESDRIAAPAEELAKAGVMADALSDGLLISGMGGLAGHVRANRPDAPHLGEGVTLSAHNDHRMAMSLALLDVRDPTAHVRERLDDATVVRKSFPQFWRLWSRLA